MNSETNQLRRQLTEAQSRRNNVQAVRADELLRLREPRHLTDAQKTKIVAALRNEPKGHLIMQKRWFRYRCR